MAPFSAAEVVLGFREGCFVVAMPEDALGEEELGATQEEDFTSALGPFWPASVRLEVIEGKPDLDQVFSGYDFGINLTG